MRLTLRTMLAYMDEILDPQDQADIGHKIEESEFATDLLHRTRDVMRRLRLGAPQLTGRGMGLDPNTVAEYLDNTLPPERVADFERICLESDVHLAEVGASHQILTLVLGEPAEVNPASREKMYRIPEHSKQLASERVAGRVDGAHRAAASTAADDEAKNHKRRQPEVPDYLRESARARRRSWLLVAALLFLAAGGLVFAFAPAAWWQRVAPSVAQQGEHEQVAPDATASDSKRPADPAVNDTATNDAGNNGSNDSSTDLAANIVPPSNDPDREPAPEVDLGSPTGDNPPAVPEGENTAGNDPENSAETPERGVEQPSVNVPVEVATAEGARVPPEPGTAKPRTPAVAEPVAGQVGIYVSDKNVLLRRDKQADDEWRRLPSRAPLLSGDELRVLPTFRPSITLNSGVALEMAGGTSIVLQPNDADGVPGVKLRLGRIVLSGVGRPGSQLRLQLGDQHYNLALSDADSTVAIELRHVLPAGADPEKTTSPIRADIYVAHGHIRWAMDGEWHDVASPSYWQLPGGSPQTAITKNVTIPAWINPEPLSEIERRASQAIEAALVLDRPADLILEELVGARQIEVRSLAARSAIYTGNFEPFVASLNDQDKRAIWRQQIDALRDVLALEPAVATRIRDAFERKRGDKGLPLYRMLWGYSNDELKSGAAAQLVKDLDHESLDYRVLAFWNLKNITGAGLLYQPEYTAARRKQPIQKWKQRLEEGTIRAGSGGEPAAEPSPPADGT